MKKTGYIEVETKGYKMAVFKVQNNALHVTMQNIKDLNNIVKHPLTFSTIIKELHDFYLKLYKTTASSIHIRQLTQNFDRTETKLIIILK